MTIRNQRLNSGKTWWNFSLELHFLMKNVFTILAKWRDLTSDRMHWIMENTANIMTTTSTVVIPAIEKIAPPEERKEG